VSIERVNVSPVDLGLVPERSGLSGHPAGKSFAALLDHFITDVSQLQFKAGEAGRVTLEGTIQEIRDIMLAADEAGIAFELLEELRNSLLEAYQEIMRTQV